MQPSGLPPHSPDELNRLGITLAQRGNMDEAIRTFQRALQINPAFAQAHFNLGITFQSQGRLEEAAATYRRALAVNPRYVNALNNLGTVLRAQKQLVEAVAVYGRALELGPTDPELHTNRGAALFELGKVDEAVACYRRALALRPSDAEALNNLGAALYELGKLEEAVACYRRALAVKPDDALAYNNLAAALLGQGKIGEAIACNRRALELKPDFAEAHSNLGAALNEVGKLDEAIACCRRALELNPDYPLAHNNLGNTYKDQGMLDEAVACYRRAVELKPDYALAHSNLIYTMLFSSRLDARTIYNEHRLWNRQQAESLGRFIPPHANDKNPDRRLRLGYLSPDFRAHPIGRFLLPLLESHDHGRFEIFCYSLVNVPDPITEQCRAQADAWREVCGFSDQQLADLIRQDRVDILVDLTMHMANNRLLVFARKPAPVQATYLAYPGTTGLDTMDYRLTDPYLDPPGQNDPFYTEQSVYLPQTYWCYKAEARTPAVNPPPSLQTGYVTFGCLNNFCKVTAPTLEAWSLLLQEVPQSRLLLHAHVGRPRERAENFFAQRGISSGRLIFVDRAPTADYFRIYERIDVALDPFPYGGGTTTCDAMWMGVPVVSLAGQTAVGRGGLSILSNVGLAELVAHEVEQYVRIAGELAQDRTRLSEFRATLRQRMQASPLIDAPRFARNMETAYRHMWQGWCAK